MLRKWKNAEREILLIWETIEYNPKAFHLGKKIDWAIINK